MRTLTALFLLLLVMSAEGRSPQPVTVFKRAHPCPATGQITGPCPGYVVDHKYPLCAGGADAPENMMWQDTAQSYVKDRLERELCACRKISPPSRLQAE